MEAKNLACDNQRCISKDDHATSRQLPEYPDRVSNHQSTDISGVCHTGMTFRSGSFIIFILTLLSIQVICCRVRSFAIALLGRIYNLRYGIYRLVVKFCLLCIFYDTTSMQL